MIATENIQTAAMSSEILANAPKRTAVMHALRSPSVVVLPATPNVKDYSFSTRTPVTVDGMLRHLETQPPQSIMLPPQNRGKEFLTTPSVVVDGVSCHHGPHTHLPSMPPSVTFSFGLIPNVRTKGKASVRVADILNRMQAEEPVNSSDESIAQESERSLLFAKAEEDDLGMEPQMSLEEFLKKTGWWSRTSSAFLNEPPVIAADQIPAYKYASQFHVAGTDSHSLSEITS
ncbi:hypothetical protein RHMOL_Rhmol07G0306600 [Rhododendron molle]|uniref:Uncharacterized protein n=1 Tax=Rhododendron molle TaxID=49168 RepID=A0ACC0N6B0_RHOML|nr:hypothetical protein RHMOL_Rhmol07G0306600 [Rhododendron molle]